MKKYIITIIITAFVCASLNAQSYKIVVNKANHVNTLTKVELSKLLLKKTKSWDTGKEVIPLDLSPKSAIRELFSKEIHGKSITQVLAFWQQSVFSGKSTPPVEFDSDIKVIEFVKTNSDAIGYVSANANTDGVKVVPIQ